MPTLGDSPGPLDPPASRQRRGQNLRSGLPVLLFFGLLSRLTFRLLRRLPAPVRIPVYIVLGLAVAYVALAVVAVYSVTVRDFISGR
ncbi:MAG: hypothetical protein FWE35_01220 [Streptosporangiales bacterium]|nr:hypothetical protein [Streptosporangiales bacterium]